MKEKHLDVIGKQYKGYKVVSYEGKTPSGSLTYKVRFDSGNTAVRTIASIKKGLVDTTLKKKATKKKAVAKTKAKGGSTFAYDEEVLYGYITKDDNILVLDQATRNTGYAIIKDGKITEYGRISQSSTNKYIRIKETIADIEKLRVKHGIKSVIVESIYLGFNPMTFRALAELLGALAFYCITREISIVTVPYAKWSSLNGLSGTRASLKIQSVVKATKIVGANLESDDVADSILIANYFLISRGIGNRSVEW